MKKTKLVAVVVLSILALIVVLQNTAVTRTQVLFWSKDMSLALLLILTFVLGFVVGVLVASGLLRKKRSKA
jgi:uncharacterized integral membrane protein